MAVPSPTGDVKSSALNSSISTFALNALIRKESGVFVNGLLEILLSFGFGSYCNCYRSKLNSGFF